MNELIELRQMAQQIDNQNAVSLYNKIDKEIERLHDRFLDETFKAGELYDLVIEQEAEIERLNNIINEIKQEMENAKHIKVEDEYHIMEHTKKLLEILKKEK